MDIYQNMQKYLKLLKLNESKMSKEQFIRHAPELERLKKAIAINATLILSQFCLSGVLVLKNEPAAVKKRVYINIQKVIDDETSKGEIRRLGNILFQTYSLDRFLEAACNLRKKIMYQAYAPYWISKCEKKKTPLGWTCAREETWYNPIIDMYWHEKLSVWMPTTGTAWFDYLSPSGEFKESRGFYD